MESSERLKGGKKVPDENEKGAEEGK